MKILRSQTTYQFTDRLLLRAIGEYNTFDRKLDGNLLFTYRLNAGTAFYLGYDGHWRSGNQIDAERFPTAGLLPTRRAFFVKLQYLFRRA